ncbi:MAG: glycosyltransferase family 4 protein [Candidatus Diapherotrites archaeon]|nr:glycosyltransferase family 4 protein [Candidatus Diapherotrites archaeon]
MKILFVVMTNKDSGIYTSAIPLAEKLRERGIDVEVDNLLGADYDLVHVFNPIPTAFMSVRVRFFDTPFVCTTSMTEDELDGLIPPFLIGLSSQYLQFVYRQCDKILCTSPAICRELSGYPPLAKKTVFFPLSADARRFHPAPELGKRFRQHHGLSRKTVLSVASVQKRKGIFDFVKLAERFPQYDFVWVGEIPNVHTLENKEDLESLMKAHPRITFTGFLEGEELLAAYAAADLFVSTSYSETFGLTILEAALCGLPVITRQLEDLANFRSFALSFNSFEELCTQLTKTLEDDSARKKMAQKALTESQAFDVNRQIDALIELYQKTIQARSD